jgi:uncharacterized protein (TIGR03435 family)
MLVIGVTGVASGQGQTLVPRSFDVASIKLNQTNSESRRVSTLPGGRFIAGNASLKLLISRAFGVAEFQVERGSGWIDTERYDISAKADTPHEMSQEELRPCLQALLTERFQLKFHRGMKQGSVYSLLVGRNGSKLTGHSGDGTAAISACNGDGKGEITGRKVTMARLAQYLSGQAGRPVIDNTGLGGEYDFRVEWSMQEATMPAGPSVFTALQEQLGLRLDATKGPVEIIVIDRVERPSAN